MNIFFPTLDWFKKQSSDLRIPRTLWSPFVFWVVCCHYETRLRLGWQREQLVKATNHLQVETLSLSASVCVCPTLFPPLNSSKLISNQPQTLTGGLNDKGSRISVFFENPPKHCFRRSNPLIPTVTHGFQFFTWLLQNSVRKKKIFRSGGHPEALSLTVLWLASVFFLYTTQKDIYGASLQNRVAKKDQVIVEKEEKKNSSAGSSKISNCCKNKSFTRLLKLKS